METTFEGVEGRANHSKTSQNKATHDQKYIWFSENKHMELNYFYSLRYSSRTNRSSKYRHFPSQVEYV